MTRIGFHASHEQISPRQLLTDVQSAERAGFDAAMCSDHFAPWSERQGHSGNAWVWLAAALATTSFRIGTLAIPGERYHPAVLAHQLATLAQMFPGRTWAALGSGEAMNEHITGKGWPPKQQRERRLEQSVDVIKRLLAGEEVTREGTDVGVKVDRAKLWDLPDEVPPLIAPAISPESAARAASWADGLITVSQPVDTLRRVIDAYRDAGGRGPVALQVHLSWAPTRHEAEAIAFDQWRSNVFAEPVPSDTDSTAAFDAMAQHVGMGAVHEVVRISESTGEHVHWLVEYAELGFDTLYLHHVGQQQQAFIETFAEHVLPALQS
ncbi:TIGR03885 family FMN-dependent LLM class oxidoreductase [Ruicaihuangia caeni]|uniref:TIGR03885 family FMN-dependent LLM class oxidoreductase n=1 Tax=Ruicaihuangia caeni TaxID=3042517 RepID=UPI00338EC247